jgi:hypothetical protein
MAIVGSAPPRIRMVFRITVVKREGERCGSVRTLSLMIGGGIVEVGFSGAMYVTSQRTRCENILVL